VEIVTARKRPQFEGTNGGAVAGLFPVHIVPAGDGPAPFFPEFAHGHDLVKEIADPDCRAHHDDKSSRAMDCMNLQPIAAVLQRRVSDQRSRVAPAFELADLAHGFACGNGVTLRQIVERRGIAEDLGFGTPANEMLPVRCARPDQNSQAGLADPNLLGDRFVANALLLHGEKKCAHAGDWNEIVRPEARSIPGQLVFVQPIAATAAGTAAAGEIAHHVAVRPTRAQNFRRR